MAGPLAVDQKVNSAAGGWYAGLDGVRALAVTLVFTVHYIGYRTRFVGWTGVLVFFVLSGFLITGILYDNQNERYRFRNFYIRRTLRIFPLFYFSWILILAAGLYLHGHWTSIQYLWLVYLGNYVRFIAGTSAPDHIFILKAPYLPMEFGHFWSLAVEEQFYLIWPLVVFWIRGRDKLLRICALTIIAVPILRAVLWRLLPQNILDMEFLYRMTFTQCDAFLLGGLLALWLRGPKKDWLLNQSKKMLWISLSLLLIAYIGNNQFHLRDLSTTSGWMSIYGYSLLDLASAGLILCAIQPATLIGRVMSLAPLRFIGRYSYGFYVYHVMLRPFLQRYVLPVSHSLSARAYYIQSIFSAIVYFIAVLLVSICSYHCLELPFLKLKNKFTVRHKNPPVVDFAKAE